MPAHKKLCLIVISALLVTVYGCAGKTDNSGASPQTGGLAIQVIWSPSKAMPSAASKIEVTITKSDSSILRDSFERSSGENSINRTYQNLPIGTAMAEISALNSAGTTLATGTGTVEILANTTVSSTISLSVVEPTDPVRRIFVANYNDGTVSVIKMSTEEVEAVITTGGNPLRMGGMLDGNVALANPGNNTVSVINNSTLEISRTYSVTSPSSAYLLQPAANTYLYVTDADKHLLKINTGTGVAEETIVLLSNAIGFFNDRSGGNAFLYLLEGAGNTYEKYQVDTNVFSQTAGTEGEYCYPTGDFVFTVCTAGGNGILHQYSAFGDILNNTVALGAGTNPQGVIVLDDLVFVACPGTNEIVWFSTGDFVTNRISVSGAPWNLERDNNSTKVYITCKDENAVKVLDAATKTITNTISVGSSPRGIFVSEEN